PPGAAEWTSATTTATPGTGRWRRATAGRCRSAPRSSPPPGGATGGSSSPPPGPCPATGSPPCRDPRSPAWRPAEPSPPPPPARAAAGADVPGPANSPAQLRQDRLVAAREGLEVETVEGDMADLSTFADGRFGLVFHPCSNCFVPDVRPIWREAFRVLQPGGV